tara:strand:+ start:272 stop:814 length:543 start_codon:yes stop_codon:yes gene_type:complete
MSKEQKKKLCTDMVCNKYFYPYKTTDKYCSYRCAAKNTNPLKRTPLKPVVFTLKPKSKDWYEKFKKDTEKNKINRAKKAKLNEFEKEFNNAKVKVKKRVKKEHGKLCCERCTTESSIQFSTHHLIYRSERPKHPMLNNIRNLLFLCFECHEWFHKRKKNRNEWIKKNKLWELFGNIWGYE